MVFSDLIFLGIFFLRAEVREKVGGILTSLAQGSLGYFVGRRVGARRAVASW